MSLLLVGFDSAWTPQNAGALVAALRHTDGRYEELGDPDVVSFPMAALRIAGWQTILAPESTLVLLDQPTIVPNDTGQRPVENLVASPVSLRYGGVQPASRSRREMFGDDAPLWPFLERFGGAANPLMPLVKTQVLETYPVLALAALGWLREDPRPTGRLPKYNPERRKTFSLADWRFVCDALSQLFRERGLTQLAAWLDASRDKPSPRKADQDGLDACLCLLVALKLAEGDHCFLVGEMETGYMVVPYSTDLHEELEVRCQCTNRRSAEWVQRFSLS